jgi:hypothetical protein
MACRIVAAAVESDRPALAALGSASRCASSRSASAATGTRQDGRPGRTVTGPDPSKELGIAVKWACGALPGGGIRRSARTGTSGPLADCSWAGYAANCAPAHAAHPEQAAWGHLSVACREPGCRSVWYSPRHEQGTAEKYSLTGSASATMTS